MDPETGCRYDFQLPLSSERPSVPGYHLGGIYGGRQRVSRINRMRVGEVGGGWISRRIPFLTGMSICPALRQLHILHCAHLEIIPPIDSPALEKIRMILRLKKNPSMDAFKALEATHSGPLLGPSQLGRMYATRRSEAVEDAPSKRDG
jgi:hypothetical protein